MNEEDFSKIVLDNGHLRVEVLPQLGAKLSSLQLLPGGVELLQQPIAPYALRDATMRFDESDASGFDECLPSVTACEVETSGGRVSIPDHGDFWRVEWQADRQGDTLRLTAEGLSLPLRFEKTLRLRQNTLDIGYSVTNRASYAVEYGWSAHPLFAVDPGDRILLPPFVRQIQVEGSIGNRLGSPGTRHAWPLATPTNGSVMDLSVAGDITDGIGDKLYTAAPAEGWCVLERVQQKQRISVHFSPKTAPYLGLWICYGGWPENKKYRQNCVALEPCTAPADSLAAAIKNGRGKHLAPGVRDTWQIEMNVTVVS